LIQDLLKTFKDNWTEFLNMILITSETWYRRSNKHQYEFNSK